jgi:acyl-CoA thioesterase-1
MNLRPVLLLAVFGIVTLSAAAQANAPRTILIVGDSLTAGYGLDDPATQSYPALLQQKIDTLALSATTPPAAGSWRVINAGISGDTTSGGLRRMDWILRQPVDVFVLALGANDGLRGLPLDLIRRNLLAIAAKVQAKNPSVRVVLAGMRMPTSMGDYSAGFDRLFAELAAEQKWPLVPFLLEGVGGVPEFNQADAIHPNAEGYKIVAGNVWVHLRPLL